MKQIILSEIHLDELVEKLSAILDSKLTEAIPLLRKATTDTSYLSRKEVSKLLKISLTTLHSWTKAGLLTSCKIGNRVLYHKKDLYDSLKKITVIGEPVIDDIEPDAQSSTTRKRNS